MRVRRARWGAHLATGAHLSESGVVGCGDDALPGSWTDAKLIAPQGGDLSSMISTLSSELVRSALDSAPDAMVLVDAKGLILFANQQVWALFGYTRDEVRGQPVELLLPERFRSRIHLR